MFQNMRTPGKTKLFPRDHTLSVYCSPWPSVANKTNFSFLEKCFLVCEDWLDMLFIFFYSILKLVPAWPKFISRRTRFKERNCGMSAWNIRRRQRRGPSSQAIKVPVLKNSEWLYEKDEFSKVPVVIEIQIQIQNQFISSWCSSLV